MVKRIENHPFSVWSSIEQYLRNVQNENLKWIDLRFDIENARSHHIVCSCVVYLQNVYHNVSKIQLGTQPADSMYQLQILELSIQSSKITSYSFF